MKIIDLLNKIANGEEVPKHIKFNDLNLYWNGENYAYDIIEENFKAPFYLFHNDELNDEIEIIEEPKKIQKIKNKNFTRNQKQIASKINEIIDYINKGDSNENN